MKIVKDFQASQHIDVLLVNMPFGLVDQPSIGLELLQAQLKRDHISSKVLYFTLQFAKTIGIDEYNRIAAGAPGMVDQLGEWLFSTALFQHSAPLIRDYIDHIILGNNPYHKSTNPIKNKNISQGFIDNITDIQANIPDFLNICTDYVLQYRPKIVGFTSLFQQHVASLALAKRIKDIIPDIKIIFGGANCEGVMGVETVKNFSFIDVVVSGEADLIISDLVELLLNNKTVEHIQGVYTRRNIDFPKVNNIYLNGPMVTQMDTLPFPDYSDYFQQKEDVGLDNPASVLLETSRGCWWGEKHHCVFCGLNGLTMSFRSKSVERALSEIICLQKTYPESPIILVDNILDMKYFKAYIPQLSVLDLDFKIFYEVKANLKKEQVRLLRDAGIKIIQPGIESFSNEILKIMNKGVKSLQNIQLLKWCKEFGVDPVWNFLWGFPDEDPNEYKRMANIIPLITHLPPPRVAQQIRLDRFSPLFSNIEVSGLTNVQPYPSASYIYPELPYSSIFNLSYFFAFEYSDHRNINDYVACCAQEIEIWNQVYRVSELCAISADNDLLIWDFRPISKRILTRLTNLEREIYLLCDTVQSLDALHALVIQYLGPVSHQEVQAMLQNFIDRDLMLTEDGHYLSLAVLQSSNTPKRVTLDGLLQTMEAAGKVPDYFCLVTTSAQNILS